MIVRCAPLLAAALAALATPALAQDNSGEAPPEPEPAAIEPEPLGEPAGIAAAPQAQPTPVVSPFSPEQRNAWLTQCRMIFLQRGARLAGAPGQPDACETQLLDYERTYVAPANGAPPVIMVRVPISRPVVAPVDAIDADVDAPDAVDAESAG